MSQNQEIIESKLCAYIDGELDSEGKAEIEKHLEANPQHRRLLESLRATRDLIRWLPREPAPPEVAETLSGQLERSVLLNYEGDSLRISPWPRILAAAAIVLLTAGLGVAVYYALPKSQKTAQLAYHTTGGESNSGDIVPAPPGSESAMESPTTAAADHGLDSESEKMRVATPEDLRKDGGSTGFKLADEPRQAQTGLANTSNANRDLDVFAAQVGQNPSAFLSTVENSNNAINQKAANATSNAMVLLVRSNAPHETEKQLTSYLNQQQIQWRQPAVASQNEAVGQQQQRRSDFAFDASKKSQVEKSGATDDSAVVQVPAIPSPTTQPAQTVQQGAVAGVRNETSWQSVAPASMPSSDIQSNSVFVCQMSRRQAEQLSNTISSDLPPGTRVQNFNVLAYDDSLDRGTAPNAFAAEQSTSEPATQLAGRAMIEQERAQRSISQLEPPSVNRNRVTYSPAAQLVPATQPAGQVTPARSSALPALSERLSLRDQTQPAVAPSQALPALGAATQPAPRVGPTTGPTEEPVNVVIMVQPNAEAPGTVIPPASTQPAQESYPQKARATSPPGEPALK